MDSTGGFLPFRSDDKQPIPAENGKKIFSKEGLIVAGIILIILIIGGTLFFRFFGPHAGVRRTIDGNYGSYQEMTDGTWQYEGNIYKYRLEITGRLNGASKDTTFVFLSNLEDIPFDRAWKAAGLSSDSNDYFATEEAVLVEMW